MVLDVRETAVVGLSVALGGAVALPAPLLVLQALVAGEELLCWLDPLLTVGRTEVVTVALGEALGEAVVVKALAVDEKVGLPEAVPARAGVSEAVLLTELVRLLALLPVSVAEAVPRGVEEALTGELAELVAVAQSEARPEGVSCADPAALPVALPQTLSLAAPEEVAEITEVAELVGVADRVGAGVCAALALSVCVAWLVAVE